MKWGLGSWAYGPSLALQEDGVVREVGEASVGLVLAVEVDHSGGGGLLPLLLLFLLFLVVLLLLLLLLLLFSLFLLVVALGCLRAAKGGPLHG